MRAGLDVGAVLTKAAWNKQNQTNFLSTADVTLEELFESLTSDGVTELVITGRGQLDIPDNFEVSVADGDLASIGRGLRQVLPALGLDPEVFGIIDIGFNTRYALDVKSSGRAIPHPFDQPLGGGYLDGQRQMLCLDSIIELDRLAEAGAAPHVLNKDINEEAGGTSSGEQVLAYFGAAEDITPMEDSCAGHLNVLATAIARDMMYHRMLATQVLSKSGEVDLYPILFVTGTPISRLENFPKMLKEELGNRLFISVRPMHAEFLGALGALHAL